MAEVAVGLPDGPESFQRGAGGGYGFFHHGHVFRQHAGQGVHQHQRSQGAMVRLVAGLLLQLLPLLPLLGRKLLHARLGLLSLRRGHVLSDSPGQLFQRGLQVSPKPHGQWMVFAQLPGVLIRMDQPQVFRDGALGFVVHVLAEQVHAGHQRHVEGFQPLADFRRPERQPRRAERVRAGKRHPPVCGARLGHHRGTERFGHLHQSVDGSSFGNAAAGQNDGVLSLGQQPGGLIQRGLGGSHPRVDHRHRFGRLVGQLGLNVHRPGEKHRTSRRR